MRQLRVGICVVYIENGINTLGHILRSRSDKRGQPIDTTYGRRYGSASNRDRIDQMLKDR